VGGPMLAHPENSMADTIAEKSNCIDHPRILLFLFIISYLKYCPLSYCLKFKSGFLLGYFFSPAAFTVKQTDVKRTVNKILIPFGLFHQLFMVISYFFN
jgi:hypothetical protein